MLRAAGHAVEVVAAWNGTATDVLIALHAKKSARSALAFRRACPGGRLIVVLTGTDVYRDLARSARAWQALAGADAIVTLQPAALRMLPPPMRRKARSIVQSARAPAASQKQRPTGMPLRVCVLGHLRTEKDPLRAAYALRLLPGMAIRVVQAGAALDERFAIRARAIASREPRYAWLGDISHRRSLTLLCRSDVLVLSSRMEGGANVLSEAIAAGVPVIASKIDGTTGILGASYPGYFPAGDTAKCARLLRRCANEPAFLRRLRRDVRALRPLVAPGRERASLLEVVTGGCNQGRGRAR
jgi:putative glycosyltransferase (TIGR04348 family)